MAKKLTLGKEEALKIAIKNINNTIGVGSVIFGDNDIPRIEKLSSGCYSLDKALGGGWAKGRIVEIYGPESSGKTTLALHAIAEIQKTGGYAAFIDMEHAFDPVYAESIGIDTEALIFSQPDHGEAALQVTQELIKSGSLDLIVIDSVAALTPKAEVDGEIGANHVGRQSRLMSQAMRMLAPTSHANETTIIFINQIRMKIGVMFGSPETTSGGESLKYYASQRVDVRRVEKLKEGTGKDIEFVGNVTRARVVKNKVAPPFRDAMFTIQYGLGIDRYSDLIDCAANEGIIKKAGAWFSYKGDNIGQGKGKTSIYLQENPDVYLEIKQILEGTFVPVQGENDGFIEQPDVSSIESTI
ncbi:recombinase RecA [Candidatus Pacearchaeota archaeon]|nr:recombinase RecA [Candidatus Pacearchaeota archaeon]